MSSWAAILGLTVLALQAAALPGSPEQELTAGEITHPLWREQPSQDLRDRFYPDRAMRNMKTGLVMVQCLAKEDGSFAGCRVVCETPHDYGSGRAAMAVAGVYKLQPKLADGRSVEGMAVTIPITFAPEAQMAPKTCPGGS